jgi:hypothetical protein
MKIFFLTQFYFDLHKPILAELEKQGHEVFLVQDKELPLDPYRTNEKPLFKFIKRTLRRILNLEVRYWKREIRNNSNYSKKYDLFLCVLGQSFHPYLLNYLRKNNQNIKTSLYLWDTIKLYDFLRYEDCFDKIQTFDLDDAEKCERAELLPSYWFSSSPRDIKYKLFVVGSDHDDRIDIVSKVYQQLEAANYPSFIKVIIKEPLPLPFIKRFFRLGLTQYNKQMQEWKSKKALPYTSEDKIPVKDIVRYIDESECVLDTDMPIQTGATERVIWALARGKKVISTNSNLKRMPFYNGNQIKIIDRNNPVLDMDFLADDTKFPINSEIESLRIDKWVYRLINF